MKDLIHTDHTDVGVLLLLLILLGEEDTLKVSLRKPHRRNSRTEILVRQVHCIQALCWLSLLLNSANRRSVTRAVWREKWLQALYTEKPSALSSGMALGISVIA